MPVSPRWVLPALLSCLELLWQVSSPCHELSLSSAWHRCTRHFGPRLALPHSLQLSSGLRLPLLCTSLSLIASGIHFPGRGRDR